MAKVTMFKGKKIVENKAKCRRCGDVLTSTNPDSTVYCKCLAVHISGGRQKLLRGGVLEYCEEMAVTA